MLHRDACGISLSCWMMMMVMMMTTTTAQKIEVDGLNEDTYHQMGDSPRRVVRDGKGKEKYVVTEEVFLDFTIYDNRTVEQKPTSGRVIIGCFGEITPITCLNFITLARGHRQGREVLTYKGSAVHRVVKDFVLQMGDVTGKRGKGGKSIYGDKFQDENFQLSHQGIGWVSMANHGRDTNGSQFFIMLQTGRWLDGKHVVFGKVLKGMDMVRKMAEMDTTATGRPRQPVKIVDSGVVGINSKYELSSRDVTSADDIAK